MLNCKITKSNSAQCETSVGGVLRMWVANYSSDYTFTASGQGCEIDTIDLGTEHFMEVFFADGTGYANANLSAGANSDQKAIMHQVGGVLNFIDCDMITDWKNWLLGKLIFAVLTKNGQVFLYGVDNGLNSTNFDYATGTAETDAQGITFLFEGVQRNAPLLVKDVKTITDLVAAPANNG